MIACNGSKYEGNIFVYYTLLNLYQHHHRYVTSRDDNQLNGDVESLMTPGSVIHALITTS